MFGWNVPEVAGEVLRILGETGAQTQATLAQPAPPPIQPSALTIVREGSKAFQVLFDLFTTLAQIVRTELVDKETDTHLCQVLATIGRHLPQSALKSVWDELDEERRQVMVALVRGQT